MSRQGHRQGADLHRVEQTIKQLGFPSHVILRPVFFMENLPSAWFLNGDKLTTTLKPETKLQMVAVDDVGKFSAKAFTDADKFKGAEIDYAGDAVTMPEAAAALSELTGKTITPDLYITVGISGASQHMAGCSGAKVIVAINKDAEANIFREARYGVVGDWHAVVPAFMEAIRNLQ